MSKRYFATDRIAWGKNHLNPGEELLDPKPEDEKVLLDILLKTNRVQEMNPGKAANKSGAGTYQRRDLTAEKPAPRVVEPEEAKTEEAPVRRSRIGAMTTASQPSISGKPDKD